MKLKKLFKLAALTLLIPAFTSCSLLGNKEETKLVSIDTCTYDPIPDEEGNIVVTITYTDEEKEPTIIKIPQGKTGADGVSITGVEAVLDEETGLISGLLITYSDESEQLIPANIKSIKRIIQTEDADGNLVLTIEFTDGTLSDPYTILKGQSGVGIDEIFETHNDDGSVDLLILYTDGNSKEVHIDAPERGVGISHIESWQDDYHYYIVIHYSDETVPPEPLVFDRGNAWLPATNGKPDASEGIDGDYAFDTEHKVIYYKENGIWVTVVDFGLYSELQHEVRFFSNAADASVVGTSAFVVTHGETFYQNNLTIPLATRPGYVFNGWSTSPSHDCTNGVFTDLTPVLSDMSLYAIWVAE